MIEDYKKAQKAGTKSYHASVIGGKYPYLPALLEMLPEGTVLPQSRVGLEQIPMELIAGTYTAGRQNAFAPNFMPLLAPSTEFAMKWSALCDAHIEEGIHDPIVAYEYMNHYYVQEGNKRVSVLKFFDAVSVLGEVVRLLPPKTEDKENKLYYEFLDFNKNNQINYLLFTKEGSYGRLTEMLGMTPEHVWTDEEKEFFYAFYYRFRQAYLAKEAGASSGQVGDALLVYIELMGYDEVKVKTLAEIRDDLGKIRPELDVQQEAKVELVMEPEKQKSALPLGLGKIVAPKKLKVAFVHDKNEQTSSWTYAHELGRMYVDEVFGDKVETKAYRNALDGNDPEERIRAAIADGNTVIFTTTPQLNSASLRVAIDHPEVKIMNCSLNISHSTIKTYYVRLYEAKLLTGIIAGALAEDDRIGYIADYPLYGMVASINAFAMGAQMANPRAKVYLKWSTREGSHPLEELVDEGICVCAGQDMITPEKNSRIFGVFSIGDEIQNVATSVTDWGRLYEQILQNILDGVSGKESEKTKSFNYWWGLDAGVLDVFCSTKLQGGTRRLIQMVRHAIAHNHYHPFEGELVAQGGQIIQKDGLLTPEEILRMDWLSENIIGSIPTMEELKPEARAVVALQGIEKSKAQG